MYSQEQADPDIQQDILSNVNSFLTEDEFNLCEGNVTLDEITRAVRELSAGKTPGSDGPPKNSSLSFGALSARSLLNFTILALNRVSLVPQCKVA